MQVFDSALMPGSVEGWAATGLADLEVEWEAMVAGSVAAGMEK